MLIKWFGKGIIYLKQIKLRYRLSGEMNENAKRLNEISYLKVRYLENNNEKINIDNFNENYRFKIGHFINAFLIQISITVCIFLCLSCLFP